MMLHVSDICKNLIFESILNKKGFRMIFEYDKFVLIKSGVYVGKSYLIDGIFKVNVALWTKSRVSVP